MYLYRLQQASAVAYLSRPFPTLRSFFRELLYLQQHKGIKSKGVMKRERQHAETKYVMRLSETSSAEVLPITLVPGWQYES
jgi:hypothetical protein